MSGKRARQLRNSKFIKSLPKADQRRAYQKLKKLYTRGLIRID